MAIYLQYGSVVGDVSEESHQNWINLKDVSWTMTRPVSNPSGSSAGLVLSTPQVGTLTVTKDEDWASISLLSEAFTGKPVSAQIDFTTTGSPPVVFYTIQMDGAIISAYAQSGPDRPQERITFSFSAITFTGLKMDPTTSLESPASFGWNLVSASPV